MAYKPLKADIAENQFWDGSIGLQQLHQSIQHLTTLQQYK